MAERVASDALSVYADESSTLPSASADSAVYWFVLSTIPASSRIFYVSLAIFSALLWGSFKSGGFFQSDLFVFAALAAAAAYAARPSRSAIRWWLTTLAPWVIAITASTIVNVEPLAGLSAILPVASAGCLGACATSQALAGHKTLLIRVLVDVGIVASALCWLGLALHLGSLAQRLNQGWRASGTMGYANATAIFLAITALAATALVARTGHVMDEARLSIILVGMLCTQSRAAIVASFLCLLLAGIWRIVPPRTLVRCVAAAVLTFSGELPAVVGVRYSGVYALLGMTCAAGLLFAGTSHSRIRRYEKWFSLFLIVSCCGFTVALIRSRVFDFASGTARLAIWQQFAVQARDSVLVGNGPGTYLNLISGRTMSLLAHNDPLQQLAFYGLFGVAALALTSYRLAFATMTARNHERGTTIAGALSIMTVAVVSSIDFPLQVPLVLGSLCFLVGATLPTVQGILPPRRRWTTQVYAAMVAAIYVSPVFLLLLITQ